MLYPALLPLMRTPRLPVVDWIDAPADLNGLIRFAERQNLFSARVPSYFKCSLSKLLLNLHASPHAAVSKINPNLLTWRIWWAPNNASGRQMGFNSAFKGLKCPLTLTLLTWRIWWAPNNASKWQMGFNSAFKGLTANISPFQRHQKFAMTPPSKPKTQPKCSSPSFCCILPQSTSPSPYFLNFPSCTLPPVWLDHKDERAVPGNLVLAKFSYSPPPVWTLSAVPVTTSQPPTHPMYTRVSVLTPGKLRRRPVTAETRFRFCPSTSGLPLSVLFYRCSVLFIFMLLVSEGQAGQASIPSIKCTLKGLREDPQSINLTF